MTGRARRTAELNDRFRVEREGRGRLLITGGLRAKGMAFVARVLSAVESFRDFDGGNDPYSEHDFGSVVVARQKVFFKFDYYDNHFAAGAADPTDENRTIRVLTIMLAEEY